jgi:hypothetical protein
LARFSRALSSQMENIGGFRQGLVPGAAVYEQPPVLVLMM